MLAGCLAATVLLTWPLWQARETPPPLPAVAKLPQLSLGWPLLAACVLLAIRPRLGAAACWLGFSVAMLLDQTRIQPQVVSLLMLSLATLNWPPGLLAARASLVSLWLFAGLHKLASPDYFACFVPWLLGPEWNTAGGWAIAAGLALAEVALGVGCLLPQTRKLAAAGAVGLHLTALAILSPLGLTWNSAVWPWNLTLAAAGPAVVLPWRGRGFGTCWREAPGWARAWAVGLLVMPLGYPLGLVDAYLAGCVYAYNTPRAFLCTAFDRVDLNEACRPLNVTLPPAPRLFEPFFQQVGRPATWLEVEDPRWLVGGSKTIPWQRPPAATDPGYQRDQSQANTR